MEKKRAYAVHQHAKKEGNGVLTLSKVNKGRVLHESFIYQFSVYSSLSNLLAIFSIHCIHTLNNQLNLCNFATGTYVQ